MENQSTSDGVSRRRFLRVTGGALLSIGCAGCISHLEQAIPVDIVDDRIEFPYSRFPALADSGGWAVAGPVRIGKYKGNVYVNRVSADSAVVLGSKCRHLGCDVEWDGARDLFVCPCHGSEYGPEGELVVGPAKKGLYEWRGHVEADRVVVDTMEAPLRS